MNYNPKLNQQFIDSSQILENYTIERGDEKSPLILTPNFSQPSQSKQTYVSRENRTERQESVYSQRCSGINARWSNLNRPDIDLFGKFVDEWETSVVQLYKFTNEQKEKTNTERPSQRAFRTALIWMFEIYRMDLQIPQPDVVVSGDGGIDIEWEFENKFISLQIKEEENGTDKIYVEREGEYGSTEVTKQNLQKILA